MKDREKRKKKKRSEFSQNRTEGSLLGQPIKGNTVGEQFFFLAISETWHWGQNDGIKLPRFSVWHNPIVSPPSRDRLLARPPGPLVFSFTFTTPRSTHIRRKSSTLFYRLKKNHSLKILTNSWILKNTNLKMFGIRKIVHQFGKNDNKFQKMFKDFIKCLQIWKWS